MPVLLGTDVAKLHQLSGESTAYLQIKVCMMVVTHNYADYAAITGEYQY